MPNLVQTRSSAATVVGNSGLLEQLAKHGIYRGDIVPASVTGWEEEIVKRPRCEGFAVLLKSTAQRRCDGHKPISAKLALLNFQHTFGQVDVRDPQAQRFPDA